MFWINLDIGFFILNGESDVGVGVVLFKIFVIDGYVVFCSEYYLLCVNVLWFVLWLNYVGFLLVFYS